MNNVNDSCGRAAQVDGLMWITDCVFQGSGGNGRAIDTNTINGGVPELYIRGVTIVLSAASADTAFDVSRRTPGGPPGCWVTACPCQIT